MNRYNKLRIALGYKVSEKTRISKIRDSKYEVSDGVVASTFPRKYASEPAKLESRMGMFHAGMGARMRKRTHVRMGKVGQYALY